MTNAYLENRSSLAKLMQDDSVFIIFAGTAPVCRGDEHYPFIPQRSFFYLTGIAEPNMILTIEKRAGKVTETLFIERFDEFNAKWVGAVMSQEKAKELSEIKKFKYIDEFDIFLMAAFMRAKFQNVYLDLDNFFWDMADTPEQEFAERLRKKCPCVNFLNAHEIISKLRLIKSRDEVKLMQKAIDLTNEGLQAIMRNLRPGMTEYQLEAHFDFALKMNGAGKGFATIAATGKNATILHYVDNNTVTKDGELILFDLGARWNWYSADISRTFPVSGKFTERQRELYNIVLEANRKVIAAVKPGLPISELNEIVISHYEKELKRLKLIKTREEVAQYYYHGVSHQLGLETHDVSPGKDAKLEKGMVITVEPGLYIEQEDIGIRIEDDILVTADGCEVLSKDIIKTVDEIEAFMAENRK